MNRRRSFPHKALTVISVSSVCIVFILVFTNLDAFSSAVSALLHVLSALIYGAVFAYLLNPCVSFIDRMLLPFLQRRGGKERTAKRFSRVVGILFAFALALFIIYAVISMIVPQLAESITGIVGNMPTYYKNIEKWALNIARDNPKIKNYVDMGLEKGYTYLDNLIKNDLLGNVQKLMVSVTSSVYAVVREIVNMLIGVVVSVYFLLSKDKFLAQTKKIIIAIWRPRNANRIMDLGRQCNKIFNGFIIGKLIDSLIIGILCYIGMLILRIPYAVLIATIIGLTNVIPYFGPIIGTIPCALLILMVNPLKCFYLVIFILVLQQVDGNLIGPRILSNNVGVSGFWVLVSITLGGGLFGFWGMLLGVPVFAVIYTLIGDVVSRAVRKKGYTERTADYYAIQSVEDIPRWEETNAEQAEEQAPEPEEQTPPEESETKLP